MPVAIVTGCSSGFGEALARGFTTAGFSVVATVRDPHSLAASLRGSVDVVTLDVTDQASRAAAVDAVVERHGRIDVLVNNAGVSFFGALEDTPGPVLHQMFDTNFFGPLALSALVLPVMRRQGAGRIVNITAIGAILCTPFLGAYCASKHALDAAATAMDVEVRPFGVRVSSVLPAQFKTSMRDKSPKHGISEPYAEVGERLAAGFRERGAAAMTDLTPVVDAALHAATAERPRCRYVVGRGSASMLDGVLPELDAIKRIEDERAGHR